MDRKARTFEPIDRALGMSGPSMNLGIGCMIIGVVMTLAGMGVERYAMAGMGLLFLALAAFFILSIDCISIDTVQNQLYLYKDYYFITPGKVRDISNYDSVCISCEIDRPRNYRVNWTATQFKTFTVMLNSKSGKKLILKESGDLDSARKLQAVIAAKTGLRLIKDPVRE